MGSEEGYIHTRREGSVFEMIIDRPLKLNGFTPKMFRELIEAYQAYEWDPTSRCAVVTANGEHFTAGLDLQKMVPHLSDDYILTKKEEIDLFGLRPPYRTKPIIYAVKGICFTLGIELMLAADIVVAASNSRFAQIEVKRGIMPTGGATTRMVSRSGWGNAMRYLLTGEEFDVDTAKSLGFVQEVVNSGEERLRALSLAQSLCNCAPLAIKAIIQNAQAGLMHGQSYAHAGLGSAQRELVNTKDFKEGVSSFREKRDPKFCGE
ncbi:MAG: crotonase/enoyl-CoA hydratase family protein [Proteobacteria bacterium]|nr:crotonase/enoyl-CoA hydratase family protein [Pseudomonadota bacterium]